MKKKPGRLLTRAELKDIKGISFCPTHLRRLIKRKAFPAPVRLGERKRFWDEAVIDAYLAERLAGG
jgi:predicted DNA-binding transcriptional regulator AlpA